MGRHSFLANLKVVTAEEISANIALTKLGMRLNFKKLNWTFKRKKFIILIN
jgi:hypothetical protein